MVAELLRLRLRLLVNGPRRSVGAAFASALGLIAVVGALLLGALGARMLSAADDAVLVRTVPIIGTQLLVLAFLVPAAFGPRELLEMRGLRGYGISRPLVAVTGVLGTLLGPAIAIVAVALLPLLIWTHAGSAEAVWSSAPLLVLQGLLLLRLGVSTGIMLRRRPRLRALAAVLLVVVIVLGSALVLLALAPRLLPLLPQAVHPAALQVLAWIGTTPVPGWSAAMGESAFGAGWILPAAELAPALVPGRLSALAVTSIVVLAAFWYLVVLDGFRATWRTRAARRRGVPGWFRIVPEGPLGAVLARSISYWSRDPRYTTSLVLVPVVPLAILVACGLAGMPWSISALLPLPVMMLMVAWGTLHNDLAYDSTAYWAHVVAETSGLDDRIGRAIPVGVIGAVLLAVGVPLTVWLQGDPASGPAVLGLGLAVLLGGIGVSSVSSARSPYAAPRPGDPAFAQPEFADGASISAQLSSLGLVVLVALPAIATTVLWALGVPGGWNWITLLAGAVVGGLALVLGIRSGAEAVERSGPELLALAMRH